MVWQTAAMGGEDEDVARMAAMAVMVETAVRKAMVMGRRVEISGRAVVAEVAEMAEVAVDSERTAAMKKDPVVEGRGEAVGMREVVMGEREITATVEVRALPAVRVVVMLAGIEGARAV